MTVIASATMGYWPVPAARPTSRAPGSSWPLQWRRLMRRQCTTPPIQRPRPIIVRYARAAAAACSLSRSLRAAAHHAARPPAGSRPDPMIFLPIPWHHPLAGTSRSRRRTSFIPASISAGTAPRTISQSARRIRRQPPVRNHRRLSALSNLKETISRQRRCRAKSP